VFAESIESVARDLLVVRPTIISGVPRVFEKMHLRIKEKGRATAGLGGKVFDWAVGVAGRRGRAKLRGRIIGPILAAESAIADRLVFSKIRDGVGGRLRFAASGSAPLSVDIAAFFQGIGIPLIEGYGLTETAPILTVNPMDAPRAGTVGKPIAGVELKIADDGEILARGPNIMSGYFNKPEATAEVLRDGWFHTGDVGSIDAEGYLTITDRKKDVLVTSGGKKIAPQPLEAILKRSPIISEAIIIGDRRKYAAALIVPDFPALERRLRDLGYPPADAATDEGRAALLARDDVRALYDEIIHALNHDLAQFERIKRTALIPAEFTIESGELTPTLKVKRKVVEQRWREAIEKLYAD
jgi:long-chain acyl-CoA synthetase